MSFLFPKVTDLLAFPKPIQLRLLKEISFYIIQQRMENIVKETINNHNTNNSTRIYLKQVTGLIL